MGVLREQYLVDDEGKKTAVLLPLAEWQRILTDLEEFRDIVAFDEAKGDGSEVIPSEQAVAEIHLEG